MPKTNDEHNSPLDQTWFAFLMLAIIAAIIVGLWLKVPQFLGDGLCPAKDKGTFGDSFGSVNALFTGLAFAGLVFSILLQQRQIRLQRADFLMQIQEMKDSRTTVQEQNSLLETQNHLLRGQTEVSLLELQVRAGQLHAQIEELEFKQMGTQVPVEFQQKLKAMRAQAEMLSAHAEQIQGHMIKLNRVPITQPKA